MVLDALLAVLALHVRQAVAPASDAIAGEPGWIMVVQQYGSEDKNYQTKNKIMVNLSGSVPSGSHSHS